jgi:hypothetical protein
MNIQMHVAPARTHHANSLAAHAYMLHAMHCANNAFKTNSEKQRQALGSAFYKNI